MLRRVPDAPPDSIRPATAADSEVLGQMLHDFNVEFGDPSPGPAALAQRLFDLLPTGEVAGFIAGAGPEGFCLFRVRPCLWSSGNETYLEELYVVPARRGEGFGKALMEATLAAARERGCTRIDLATGETDTAARALYERFGFSNREGGPDGPAMLFYDRDL